MIWFTADNHFGHANIIKFAHRPFASAYEMDEVMITRWNERVQSGDLVYHLGDFAFADQAPYLRRLRGTKHLIVGNHDHSNRLKPAVKQGLWAKVSDIEYVKGTVPLVLCHYALRVWNKSHHGALHFYGHSHGNLPGDSQCTDVGVDCWDFRPVSLDEIMGRLATLNPRRAVDHHV